MRMLGLALFAVSLSASIVTATSGSIAARDNITNKVLEVTVDDYSSGTVTPSSQNRAESLRKRQSSLAYTQVNLASVFGRAYLAKVTVGSQPVALAIKTASPNTWVTEEGFICLDHQREVELDQSKCRLGPLYNREKSETYIDDRVAFQQALMHGPGIRGHWAIDELGTGGVHGGQFPNIMTPMLLGIAEAGMWNGENICSGSMGLSFPRRAEAQDGQLRPTRSVLYSLFNQAFILPIFSLALNRPTADDPSTGGFLGLGGIPNVKTDNRWVETPTTPIAQDLYDDYIIRVEGFNITPPAGSFSTEPPGGRYVSSRLRMAIDSGKSSLVVPNRVAAYFASLFKPAASYDPREDRYFVPCNARENAPRIGIKIEGTSYFISTEDLLTPMPGRHGIPVCRLAVVPSNGLFPTLGVAWLKNVVVEFDMTNYMDVNRRGSRFFRHGVVRIAGRQSY
ncbi:aspartic peptidase domain-containing protein [Ampelomyces quisqualis]|uniref:Aspartic peptidase domain-containing protein n=1 Tax=Ampelomyces quisqualis TaxID=50730 RepID=A0A6A5QHM5_AMPQU|nr:aspartic peptidase domain-containing protein [Ampelomyces quisqualis]